jgi:hypothetical protein
MSKRASPERMTEWSRFGNARVPTFGDAPEIALAMKSAQTSVATLQSTVN